MRFTLIFLPLFFFISSLTGQIKRNGDIELTPEMIYSFEGKYNSWSISAGFGPVFMYSDVIDYTLFPSSNINFGPSLVLTKHLVPAFAFELQYLQGDMYGEKDRFTFEGDLQDVTLNAIAIINQMSSRPGPINDRWNYYVKIGVGATLFRSRLHHKSDDRVVRENEFDGTGPSRYVVQGYDTNDPNKKTSRQKELVMPIGAGIMYRINSSFDIGLESTMHFSSADNLDNILSGSTNDRYLFTAVNLSYKFGKKSDRRHLRWTYRGYDMNLFGNPKKDPRLDELNRLEEDIADYARNRPVKKDSVIIEETLRIVYDREDIRTIFFNTGTTSGFQAEDQILMSEVAIELLKNKSAKLILYGYANPSGDAQRNMELSRQRAESVKEFLITQFDVSEQRISVVPKGDVNPLSPTQKLSPRGLEMVNRRVDMIIIQ